MTRFARLMAATMAALFTGALAAPAYATGGGGDCDSHSALRTFSYSGCKAEGTKFNDLDKDGKRDAGEPGLAGFRIWADYDNDGVLDAGEPYDDTDASGKYAITGINPPSSSAATRTFGTTPRRTACARSWRAGAAPATGLLLPERLDLGRLRHGQRQRLPLRPRPDRREEHAQGDGQGLRQLPQGEAEDHGHQGPRPEQRLRPLRPQGRRRHRQGGRRRRRHGLDARRARSPPGHGDRRVRHDARRLRGLDLLPEDGKSAATTPPTARAGSTSRYGDEIVCTMRNVRLGTVEIEKQTDPDETNGTSFGFSELRRRLQPRRRRRQDDHARHPARRSPTRSARTRPRATACRRSAATTATARPPSPTAPRASRWARARRSAARSSTRSSSPACRWSRTAPRVVHHGDTMTFTFAVSNTRQLAAARRARDRRPLRRRVRRSRWSAATTTATRCSRPPRCGSSAARCPCLRHAHDGERGGPGVQRRHGDRRGRGGHATSGRPTTTAPTSSNPRPSTSATAHADADAHARTPTPPAAAAGRRRARCSASTQRPVSEDVPACSGASGCVSRGRLPAVVSGRQIRRVTFFVDGRRVARRTARGNQRSFTARIRPARLGLRRPPGHRPRGVPDRLGHPPAHAAAELPALRRRVAVSPQFTG